MVEDASGQSVGLAVSDSSGEYELSGLPEATYSLSANGQSAVTYVGHGGVTINWGISGNSVLATARPGLSSTTSEAGNSPSPANSQPATLTLLNTSNGVDCSQTPDVPACKVCNHNTTPKKCSESPSN